MIPAWRRSNSGGWEHCWLLSTAPYGTGNDKVLIAFDDKPRPNHYPVGSLRIESTDRSEVRVRRNVIPLFEEMPDGDK